MCLVLVALNAHPEFPVVVAANRDERHDRPAHPLHWWPDRPEIAGGRDARAGGTWMGVRSDGRFAALLNDARAPAAPDAPSRGELVPHFLAAAEAGAAIGDVHGRSQRYAGFHFVAGEAGRVWYTRTALAAPRTLGSGVHGIDNHGLDSGGPRLERGRAALTRVLERAPTATALLDLLSDEQAPEPGPGDARPLFVRGESFGTRCSTVLLLDAEGRAELVERSYDARAACGEQRGLEWAVALAAG